MNKQEAEIFLNQYTKQIFSYAIKNINNLQDAEDLAQNIIFKAYLAFTKNDSIIDKEKYLWTIAHNELCNFYKEKNLKTNYVVSTDEIDKIQDKTNNSLNNDEHYLKLENEIAYLSKLKRKLIIKCYYENKKIEDISNELNIPIGTIKWHLFTAKKELKEGISKMRKPSVLKFNPIEFRFMGISGQNGNVDVGEIFRSSLSQNICYSSYHTPKTINQIAEELGVSPVYIESEIDYLEKYNFIKIINNKVYVEFIINEPNEKTLEKQYNIYHKAASNFSIDLYNEIINSNILSDNNIICNIKNENNPNDKNINYILWSIIPYIISMSDYKENENLIDFDEVATHRPDGSYNFFYTDIYNSNLTLPKNNIDLSNWCGPMWNKKNNTTLWEIINNYTDKTFNPYTYQTEATKIIDSFSKEINSELLTIDEYTFLKEKGYIKTEGKPDEIFKSTWLITIINNTEINNKLIEIGNIVKEKHKELFIKLRNNYLKEIQKNTPKHLYKIRQYQSQHLFKSNAYFVKAVLDTLLNTIY